MADVDHRAEKNHGYRIKEVLTDVGMSQVELARRINRTPPTVHSILKREKIDIELLEAISVAMNHDFVNEFYNVPHKSELPKKKRKITTVSLSLLDGEIIDVSRNKEVSMSDLMERIEAIAASQKMLIEHFVRNTKQVEG